MQVSPTIARPSKKATTAVRPVRDGAGGNGRNGADGDGARSVTSSRHASFTVPGVELAAGGRVADLLQVRLASLVDLSLTLKHIHWNVVGPNFIAVHQMLDPQYEGVQQMVDDLAERIAALGGVPSGLIGRIAATRTWDDYSLDRADSLAHLGALDLVYAGVIGAHREAMDAVADDDRVSEDLLIGQTGILERYHWFVRSHLADWAGGMANAGSTSELGAATSVATKSRRRQPSGQTTRQPTRQPTRQTRA
jgi:starvation-inducible DNA-binding protein